MKQTQLQIRSGHKTLTPSAEAAYLSFLGYYMDSASDNNPSFRKKNNTKKKDGGGALSKKLKPSQIVDFANQLALCMGLMRPPSVDSKTISRLGIEGLVEVEDETWTHDLFSENGRERRKEMKIYRL